MKTYKCAQTAEIKQNKNCILIVFLLMHARFTVAWSCYIN